MADNGTLPGIADTLAAWGERRDNPSPPAFPGNAACHHTGETAGRLLTWKN